MTNLPTLAETLAVQPEQLTGLTPVEVDRYNMVLSDEFARVDEATDKACERLYGALLLSKESVRRGRGWSRVWPISLPEAEKRAREHLATGYEPEQRDRLQHGLMREGAYAEQLRAAVEKLDALRAERKSLADGPAAVLDGEFRRRGGWTRMHLCTTDGGHIHTGRQCPSIGPRTPLVWLPEVSGMDWRDAYRLIIKDMTAGTEAIMCSKKTCFPDAPTEWTQRQAPDTECPGSRQYAKLMAPGMIRRVHRWAECHVCHKKDVTVTANGNLRKHDRPEGGEEPKPEAPAPQAPAAPAPKDDNRLVVIERTPLQTPPAAEESSKSKPGGAPTVTAVIKFLSAAGFQHSRYGDNPDRISSGARAQSHRDGVVRVTWREGFEDFVRRMNALGVQEPKDVPEHPKKAGYLKEYAEALAPRYRVEVSHGAVYVHRREELPARPPKVPTAVTVRKALAAAGIRGKISAPYSVVDQPDHTRVAVFDDTHLDAVRKALAAEGWTFTEGETWQHFAIKITGATPDQAARRRKLRQERASRAAVAKVEKGIRREKAAAAQEAPAPAPAPVATEEPATPTQEPEGQPVRISRCGPDGRRWWQGQRVVFKTRDMFLYSGEIAEFGEQDGESTATVLMDTRRAAPASRPMYKGDPNLPGKARPISPPEEWVLPLAKLKPA